MMETLTSWLEDGGAVVSQELAQKRGVICAACPQNVSGDWWEKISKQPVAQVIKNWLEQKNAMNLSVPIEREIGICKACGCCNLLKIHEPLHYIKEHMDEQTSLKLDINCWILSEG